MGDFNNSYSLYNQQQDPQNNPYYDRDMEYSNLQSQQLSFQSFEVSDNPTYPQQQLPMPNDQYGQQPQYPELFTPAQDYINAQEQGDEYDEPPLLEELEIYPERIMEKTMAVLNPFRSHGLADDAEYLAKQSDLAGPLAYCMLLAICLFLSGYKTPFGYIYGLSMVSCILMYFLLSLMTTNDGVFTITSVASILGYCIIPIVSLSVVGIFLSLHNPVGFSLACVAVVWSSLSASRLFVAMSGDNEQKPLIAYPCALVYGVVSLLIVF